MSRGKQLHGGADQLGEITHFELVLELGADIDDGLVADIEFVGDIAVRLALGQERKRLQLARRQFGERILRAGVFTSATCTANSWLKYGSPARTVRNAFKKSSEEVSLRT